MPFGRTTSHTLGSGFLQQLWGFKVTINCWFPTTIHRTEVFKEDELQRIETRMMMWANIEDEEKRELRKQKNRESAEKNRREKNDTISTLQAEIIKLSTDIHSASVNNWYLSQNRMDKMFREPFPSYVAPTLEPAVF